MSLYESFQNVISSFGMKELTHPIFYNCPIGIRFNIGDNGNEVYIDKDNDEFSMNPNYVTTCLERGLKIYASLKSKPDILSIEGYLYENETVEDFISSVLSATDLPKPNEIKSELTHDDEDEFIHVFLLWKLNKFNPNKLLEEIWNIAGEFVNDNTLTVYIKRLREKIERDPQNPEIIRTVRGLGYRLGE